MCVVRPQLGFTGTDQAFQVGGHDIVGGVWQQVVDAPAQFLVREDSFVEDAGVDVVLHEGCSNGGQAPHPGGRLGVHLGVTRPRTLL